MNTLEEARKLLANPQSIPRRRLVVALSQAVRELEQVDGCPECAARRAKAELSGAFWACGHLRSPGEVSCRRCR